MIEFLQKNAWIISSGSLLISLIAAYYTIRNVRKNWKDAERVKFFKSEQAVLKPVLELSVENYFETETTIEGNSKSIEYKPKYSKLNNIIKGIPLEKIKNELIAKKLKAIQRKDIDDLFRPTMMNDSVAIDFCAELNDIIILTRQYLAEIN